MSADVGPWRDVGNTALVCGMLAVCLGGSVFLLVWALARETMLLPLLITMAGVALLQVACYCELRRGDGGGSA